MVKNFKNTPKFHFFYKIFINKKEGMGDHHELVNQNRNQHLGISTTTTTADGGGTRGAARLRG